MIRPINMARILFAVEPDQRKSSTYHLVTKSVTVSNGELLKILIFSDRSEKEISYCISELENGFVSLFIFNYTPSFPKDCTFINQE